MSERFDPIADPLTPFWRAKVERAFHNIPAIPGEITAFEARVLALADRGLSQEEIARRANATKNAVSDALFRARAKTRVGA